MAFHPSSEQPGGPDDNPPTTENEEFSEARFFSTHLGVLTLHLYRPSGEFCCAHTVSTHLGVRTFTQQLENGQVTPELDLTTTKTRAAWSNREAGTEVLQVDHIYKLVWNDMVLLDRWNFCDYVLGHGMSQDEPIDITVVTKECVSTIMSTLPS